MPLESTTANFAVEDTWTIAAQIFAPCYIGGWSAAAHWGFTEQLFRSTLVMATRRPRSRQVQASGAAFVLRTIEENTMFGLATVWRGRMKVNISDPTRTIVDLLDAPELGGGIRSVLEMLQAYFRSKFRDPQLLLQYADQLGNKAVFKRLGYLASTFLPSEPDLIGACKERLSTGIANLDPKLPLGPVISEWRLRIPAGFGRKSRRD